MLLAIREAELSLKEGNCGFGAVIHRNGEIIAQAHDTEKTEHDPTAHAELKAIRCAAVKLRGDFTGCSIISTHEPCPMCSTAILWAGIDTVAYGFSIREAIEQGRRRIDLTCRELFERAGKQVAIREGVFTERCAILYNRDIRAQIELLGKADEASLLATAEAITGRRIAWLEKHLPRITPDYPNLLDIAYSVILLKLDIDVADAPIIERTRNRLVFASVNFCPTLEACRILGLDTRIVCKHLTEKPTDAMVRRIDPRLRFSRNYGVLRPFSKYCEEMITLEE